MKKIILMCVCFAFIWGVQAQTEDKKWSVELHGGATQYHGDAGNDFYRTKGSFFGFGGFAVSRFISNHFDVSLAIDKGTIGTSRDSAFNRTFTSALVNFRFNILESRYAVRPYFFVGGGAMLFDKNLDIQKGKVDYVAPSFGGGISFRLNPSASIVLQETFLYSTSDKRDGVINNENDAYLFHSVGVSFNFGKKKDADKDGVSDHRDKCPNTPTGVAVDKKGCPLDKDGDSVADYLDACPDLSGLPALNGCPDRDADGVADKDDRCPDTAGLATFNGCPDTDNDGIADTEDRCPTIAGTLALKGCPDADNDGVADLDDKCPNTKAGYKVDASGCTLDNDKDGIVNEEDRCPDQAGTPALKGCPDTDGDGVADIEDRCPKAKGSIANGGCPDITKEDIKKITEIGSKIFFETNSDKLKLASMAQLDELINILNKYEAAKLTIEGYTDSQGADEFNMQLSQRRTESVKTYLMSKGVMESRLIATGYGETKPVADNKTALGRSKNRRVELKTSY